MHLLMRPESGRELAVSSQATPCMLTHTWCHPWRAWVPQEAVAEQIWAGEGLAAGREDEGAAEDGISEYQEDGGVGEALPADVHPGRHLLPHNHPDPGISLLGPAGRNLWQAWVPTGSACATLSAAGVAEQAEADELAAEMERDRELERMAAGSDIQAHAEDIDSPELGLWQAQPAQEPRSACAHGRIEWQPVSSTLRTATER